MSDHKTAFAPQPLRFLPIPPTLPRADRRSDRRIASRDTMPAHDDDEDQPKLFEVLYRVMD
jgi:hypothetical protein